MQSQQKSRIANALPISDTQLYTETRVVVHFSHAVDCVKDFIFFFGTNRSKADARFFMTYRDSFFPRMAANGPTSCITKITCKV